MIAVFDGHLDSLQAIYLSTDHPRPLAEESHEGHFDLPRARKGHFVGGLFAVFFPSGPKVKCDWSAFPAKEDPDLKTVEIDMAVSVAQRGIDALHYLAGRSAGTLRQATCLADVTSNMAADVISAVLHFEGAEPIAPDLANLNDYYQAGLRSLGLVWSRPNAFGHGVDFQFPGSPDTGPGLTPAGKALVAACNQLGIMIDLSHLNEQGFWDVQQLSQAPLVATHSCMHRLTPISRNLTDRQLDAIKDSNGVVGVNFCTGFLRKDAKLTPDTPIEDIVQHICYAVDKMGIEHVAIGSDFDGTVIPQGIGDVSGLPNLIDALFKKGFNEAEIKRIAYANWLRIFSETWKKE